MVVNTRFFLERCTSDLAISCKIHKTGKVQDHGCKYKIFLGKMHKRSCKIHKTVKFQDHGCKYEIFLERCTENLHYLVGSKQSSFKIMH